jgi:3-oxoacyl-(acyl-carrier-protein) synthase
VHTLEQEGPRRLGPFLIPMIMSNGASGMTAIDTGARGPSFSVASACASSADGLGQAWLLLRAGVADVAIAGGAEATVTRIGIAAFDRLGALSHRNDNYDQTPSPFDLNRDGLVMGEGERPDPESRARPGARRDGPGGAGGLWRLADAFATALREEEPADRPPSSWPLATASAKPADVDYINAHGTGTKLNDLSKPSRSSGRWREAIDPISSTKSMTGHMMGATGALRRSSHPGYPHRHHPAHRPPANPDPECDLDYVPNQVRRAPVRLAISNAFGFGGHNAVLAFRAYSP